MYYVLIVMHTLVCLAIIGIVLLQAGKGADIGSAFGGGGSQAVFGSMGTPTILGKITTVVAIVFMITSFSLAKLSSRAQSVVPASAPAPAAETPGARGAACAHGAARPAEVGQGDMSPTRGRGRVLGALGALVALAGLALLLPRPAAPQAAGAKVTTAHAFSMYGDLKYPAGFTHFQYVNPEAPKGGDVKLAAIGTFDTLNPFVLKGVPAVALGSVFDTLTVSSDDEPFSQYGLVAETIEMPADRSWVAFTLRPQARFHDGSPITVEDVIWTFDTLKTKGRPFYRELLRAGR